MKDAIGELSMTAIAVVAIAAIAVVFTTLIWPTIQDNIKRSTYCSQVIKCDPAENGASTQKCYYCKTDSQGQESCNYEVTCTANDTGNNYNNQKQ